MAFAAVTILMDTLHQHFLQPTPRFPLRNKTKAKFLYRNLSSLQTFLEQELKVGEYDEATKDLEAQLRDALVELRFQIEHQLTLFYLGKAMKLRLQSAQKLLPILNRAIEAIETMGFGCMLDILMKLRLQSAQKLLPPILNEAIEGIETMGFGYVLDILTKHFSRPVWRMPPHIKKRLRSFWTLHPTLFYYRNRHYKKEVGDEQENNDEQESDDEQESSDDEQESSDEQESDDEQEINDEQGSDDNQDRNDEQDINDEQGIDDKPERNDEQETESDDEWKTEEDEQESDDERKTDDEQVTEDEVWSYMLSKAESIIRQELRGRLLSQ